MRISPKKLALLLIIVTLSGCAHHYTEATRSDPYGFFSGMWHGIIFPLTLFVNLVSWFLSLFDVSFLQDIQIIGRPNSGFLYYFGFALGLSSTSGSTARG